MTSVPVYVGIDVAKSHLDVALRPTGEAWRVTNDENGHRQLVQRLRHIGPTLLVLEATGGYEVAAVSTLAAAGLPLGGGQSAPSPRLCPRDRPARED